MKYLRKFETEADVIMTVKPNVVLAGDTGSVLYNVDSSGAYIQHVDGTLYTIDEWTAGGFTSDLANGVAVIDIACQFVVAKELVSSSGINWLPGYLAEGVTTASTASAAETDYAGVENTAAIVATGITSGAGISCANYTFPNGQKGYLPALGELVVCFKYRTDITAALSLLSADITLSDLWSSTQNSATKAWYFSSYMTYNATKNPSGGSSYKARAFTTLAL